MLKMTTKTTHHVKYGDLERLIEETYGFPEYSIACEEECNNDTALTFDVNAAMKYRSEYDFKDLEEMIATKKTKQWRTGLLMDDMCRRGLIPEGSYVVEVSW